MNKRDTKYYHTFTNGSGATLITLPKFLNIPPGINIKYRQNKDGTILLIPEGVAYEETT